MKARNLGPFAAATFYVAGLAGVDGAAHAQFDPGSSSSFFRGTTPQAPVAGQAFVLDIYSGPCESLSELRTAAVVEPLVGNTLTIRIPAVSGIVCAFTPGERQYDIAPFSAPGTYRVRVEYFDIDPNFPGGYIGARDITVVAQGSFGGTAVSIPANQKWGLSSLVLLVLALGALGLRRRA